MSLINDMLKNLEKRELQKQAIPFIPMLNQQTLAENRFFQNNIVILSSIAIFILLLSLGSYFFSNRTMTLTPMLPNDQPVSQPVSMTNHTSNWLDPVLVKGVSFQAKNNVTEITFLLNHPALYRLESNESLNLLSLIIDQSQLQAGLPQISSLNTPVQRLSAIHANGATRFNFLMVPGSHIQYVNLADDEKNPALVIALSYESPVLAKSDSSSSNTFVKNPVMHSVSLQAYQQALKEAENGNYQIAMKHLESVLKVDGNFKDARVTLTALLLDQGNPLKANQMVDAGLVSSPEYAPFIELKARILAEEGHTDQALDLMHRISPSITEDPEYHALIAALYEKKNDNHLAANIYQQLLTLNAHNGNWWFGLGVSLDKLGDSKQAITAYTRALSEGQLNTASISHLQNRLRVLNEAGYDNRQG